MIALWLVAAFALAWVVVIYPVYVLTRAKRTPASMPRPIGDEATTVSVLIVVRDGGPWVKAKLASVLGQRFPREQLDVVVVSDGSTDETDAVLAGIAAAERRVRILRVPAAGKAAAIGLALPHLRGEIVVLTDVRQPLDPDAVPRLVARFQDADIGVVSGELRFPMATSTRGGEAGFYWRIESAIRNALGHIDSTVGATGPLYAIRRSLLTAPPAGTILDDVYIPSQAFFSGYRLVVESSAIAWEQPIDPRQEFRRKVRTASGWYQLLRLEPRFLSWRDNRMLSDFLSYKIGRLLVPHLLLVEFIAVFLLPSPWKTWLLVSHGIVVVLVVLGALARPGTVLRKVGAPVTSFMMMAWAAFVAQRVLVSGFDGLWVPTRPLPVAEEVE